MLSLTMRIAKAWGGLQFTAVRAPLPGLGALDQFTLGNVLVRLATYLDLELGTVIHQRHWPKSGDRLKDRITDVGEHKPNEPDLHELRKLRNKISHDFEPPLLEWSDVWDAHFDIETALNALGALSPAFGLSVQVTGEKVETIAPSIQTSDGMIWSARHVFLRFFLTGAPYCDVSWRYEYIV